MTKLPNVCYFDTAVPVTRLAQLDCFVPNKDMLSARSFFIWVYKRDRVYLVVAVQFVQSIG